LSLSPYGRCGLLLNIAMRARHWTAIEEALGAPLPGSQPGAAGRSAAAAAAASRAAPWLVAEVRAAGLPPPFSLPY
jgi:hypothetical protein